jgi:FlaA1/EpsC-like NDP-sugar epimerase
VNLLRSISLESLIGRDSINVDFSETYDFYKNKTVFITGAAGSNGGELAISLANYDLKKMILVDSNETRLFNLSNNKAFKDKKFDLEVFQLNILNNDFFKEIFINKKNNYVFHAAAYKHFPINEANPLLGLYNNIISTYNTLINSLEFNIEKFILVSMDKAVNPISVMGASKRICEMMTFLDEFQSDKFSIITTRFGNVLGSNVSVVNIFKEQILKGVPVEVTHKDITRYFMKIPEAAKLVCEACRIGFNNYLYLFDMGQPVKIDDLARNMISLNGLTPDVDIEIKYVGLRPGEKLY